MKNLGRVSLLMLIFSALLFAKVDINGSVEFRTVVDKNRSYIGEKIILRYIFKHKMNAPISDASFQAPKFDGFWVKKPKISKNKTDIKNGYKIYRLSYILYPQRSGILHIKKGIMDIGVIDRKKRRYYSFNSIKREKIYSNSIDINVSKLPKDVKLCGEYNFSAVLDKNKTTINSPVNLTITITGSGNVDDIEDFVLNVKNATVYSDRAKRLVELKGDEDVVVFKQKFALVADRNFTIEPIEFKYFDLNSKKIKLFRSKEFRVEVIGSNSGSDIIRAKKEPIKSDKKDSFYNTFFISSISLLSLLLGFLVGAFYKRSVKRKKTPKKEIQERIKRAKSDKELLSLLLPFLDRSSKVKDLVERLEENVYQDKNHKINKKEIYRDFDKFLKDDEIEDILN